MVKLKIEKNDLHAKLKELKKDGYSYLVKITAVDYVKYLTVIYIIRDLKKNAEQELEVDIDASDSSISTVMDIYRAADWYEREMQEMFGIEVKGRRAGRLLLEKWNGKAAPLKKNFEWGADYET